MPWPHCMPPLSCGTFLLNLCQRLCHIQFLHGLVDMTDFALIRTPSSCLDILPCSCFRSYLFQEGIHDFYILIGIQIFSVRSFGDLLVNSTLDNMCKFPFLSTCPWILTFCRLFPIPSCSLLKWYKKVIILWYFCMKIGKYKDLNLFFVPKYTPYCLLSMETEGVRDQSW